MAEDIHAHNDLQPEDGAVLNETMMRMIVQNAVQNVRQLRDVTLREQDNIFSGQPPCDFTTHIFMLRQAASGMDHTRRRSAARRRANVSHFQDPMSVSSDHGGSDDEGELSVNQTHLQGSRMSRSTWSKLDESARQLWDTCLLYTSPSPRDS